MPFYYDVSRASSSSATPLTEVTHLWAKTVANQETVGISGFYATARLGTAGGASIRMKTNTGTVASGGTATVPTPKNSRGAAAAQSTWFNDATAIVVGTTLITRMSIGMAQTGGTGGYQAPEASAKLQMMPNSVSPIDIEFTSVAAGASVPFDLTVEFSEGI